MDENNNTTNDLKGKNRLVTKGVKSIHSAFSLLFGTLGSFVGVIIIIIIMLAASIFLLVSMVFGGGANPPTEVDEEAFQTTVTDTCKGDVNSTISWMRDIYVDTSKDVTLKTKDYVIKVLGDEASSIPDVDDGFLAGLKEFFGIGHVGADLNLKDWRYPDYGESNKIDLHFNKSYLEIGQTLYGYASATVSALDNYERAYESNKKCDKEGGCSTEEFYEDDFSAECENNPEGCSIEEITAAMGGEKKQTVSELLAEQNSAGNKSEVFYVKDSYDGWRDTLKMGEWEVDVKKEGSCQVSTPNGICDSDKENYTVTWREEKGEQDPTDPTVTNKVYIVHYTYTEKEKRTGPVGDIYVPIYINSDEFLKDKKKEIIDLMTEDLSMTQIEASTELTQYINASFESSMLFCDFKPDYELFGSGVLIGVGSHGAIGSLPMDDFEQYAGMDPFDPELNASVWGEAFTFIKEGKIRAPLSYQCTTFVHWMFYKVYGYDCAIGHGKDMAANLADSNENFIKSDAPAPGAVASSLRDPQYGHVLFINAVYDDDGDGVWDRIVASDGNVDGTVTDTGNDGVRIMHEYSKEQFLRSHGPLLYAVPVK